MTQRFGADALPVPLLEATVSEEKNSWKAKSESFEIGLRANGDRAT